MASAFKNAKEIENLAASVKDNGDVYLVPAFAGLARRIGINTRAASSADSRAVPPRRTLPRSAGRHRLSGA